MTPRHTARSADLRPAVLGLTLLGLVSQAFVAVPAAAQLTALGNALLDQCDGSPNPCEAGDRLGYAVAAGDFDGDGFEDLAVGIPYETISGVAAAGAVHVFYGSVGGLRTTGDQLFTQSSSGIAGGIEADDRWGWSLAAGRFDLDAYDDLAIGGPYEDLTAGGSSRADAGAVWVLFGSASGLTGAGSRYFDQETSPISGESIETNDRFGEVLAANPSFRADVHDALLIGTPSEDGLWIDEGLVVKLAQSAGLPLAGTTLIRQNHFSAACGESSEFTDNFGAALGVEYRRTAGLTSSDFDLVVGAPGEGLGLQSAAGRLGADYHIPLTLECWDQDTAGVLGAAEAGDEFSAALALGDFDADGDSDLAVGAPGEELAELYQGMVHILYSNGTVLTGNLDQTFDQGDFADSAGEGNDWFGDRLAVGDFDGDGAADLVIGVPYEDLTIAGTTRENAGEINVLYGAPGSGISAAGSQTFHQNLPSSMQSIPQREDQFGAALAVGDFDGNGIDDLAVGVPGDETGGQDEAGSVQVLYGLDGALGAFGTVQFGAGAVTLDESDGATVVVITRSGSAVVAATVDHGRSGGTATPGTDFSYTAGTESWGVGDDSFEAFTFTVLEDTLDEPAETLVLALSSPSAGTALGVPATFTVTIVDNDVAGALQFAVGSSSLPEAGGTATVAVSRTGGTASGVTVHYETWDAGGGTATAGLDYTPVSGTLAFAVNETSRTFQVTIRSDLVDEPSETVLLRLSSPGGGGTLGTPSVASLTILDDDPPGRLFVDGFESGGKGAWSASRP